MPKDTLQFNIEGNLGFTADRAIKLVPYTVAFHYVLLLARQWNFFVHRCNRRIPPGRRFLC